MTKFTVDITDPASLKGVALARAKHNADLPDTEAAPREDHADYTPTDADYMQWVGVRQCKSYADQHGVSDEKIAELEVELAARKAARAK